MKYVMQFLGVGLLVLMAVPLQAQTEQNGDKSSAATEEAVMAADTSVTFTVYGNCGMCQRRIEGAVAELDGVSSAEWNKDTKEMSVTYNTKLVTLDDVQKKIAEVGHDTDKFRAKDSVYNDLPGCCQYDRPKS